MNWFIYAFICAVLLSASSVIEKRILNRVHAMDFSASLSVLNLLCSIPFLFFIRFSELSGFLLLLVFITALFSASASFLVIKGTRHLEVSTVYPLLALSPGSTALLAFFVLGEKLSGAQTIGIFCMVIGSYILTIYPGRSIFDPLRTFLNSRYIHLVLLSLLFYSLGAIFDRTILHSFSVAIPAYIFFVNVFTALLFVSISGVFGVGFRGIREGFRKGGTDLWFVAILTVFYRLFEMQAIQLVNVGLVSAVKRISSFFTTVIGGEIFHEHNLKRKIIASFIIVIGTFLVVL